MDGALARGRLQRAIEDGQVLGLQVGSSLDGPVGVNEIHNLCRLLVGITKLEERFGNNVIDDLDEPAAHQLLVFHQSQIRLNARGIAIHHEADGAGRSKHGDLCVTEAMLHAAPERLLPNALRRLPERIGNVARVNARERLLVHRNHPQE